MAKRKKATNDGKAAKMATTDRQTVPQQGPSLALVAEASAQIVPEALTVQLPKDQDQP
jgi:hypothetical protein